MERSAAVTPEQLAAQGLRPETLVWAEGMSQWQRADALADLAPILAKIPAGQPAQAQQPMPGQQPPFATPVGYAQPGGYSQSPVASNKLAAGLCGIFLGAFGVHKFLLGYNTAGIIMLVASITCVGYPIMHVIGLIEGIIYLTKTDPQFYQEYVVNRKEWF